MQLRAISALFLVLTLSSSVACVSTAARTSKWNAAQISEIRKRAAFAMSCDPEDLEIVAADRDPHGRVRALRVVGCERKATYVMAAGDAHAPPRWTLDMSRLSARN